MRAEGEPVLLWGVGNRERAGEGGVGGLREVVEAPEAGRCWRVQPQRSSQLRDPRACWGGQRCGLGLAEGWSARGGRQCLGGRRKRGAARWAEVQQRGERHKGWWVWSGWGDGAGQHMDEREHWGM